MELKDLRYFIAVAEEGSFSRAAHRLHITQPPLSIRIRDMEREMAITLFQRSTRKVELTEAGHVFLDEARHVLTQLGHGIQTAQRVHNGQIGHLTLSFVPSASSNILPPLLRKFRQNHPEVTVSLNEMNPAEQVKRLHARRTDAAFFYLPSGSLPPFGYSDLDSKIVQEEPLVVAFPKGHPLSAQRRVHLETLAHEPFVLLSAHRGPGLRDIILEQCRKAGFTPNVVQEATLIQTIGGLVASATGVALVPASLRRLQRTGVDYRPIAGDPPMIAMGIVWRQGDRSPILKTFMDTVLQPDIDP